MVPAKGGGTTWSERPPDVNEGQIDSPRVWLQPKNNASPGNSTTNKQTKGNEDCLHEIIREEGVESRYSRRDADLE